MGKTLKIAYMGTPDFAVPALRALYEAGHTITCVYTQPPRPKGRGHKVQKSPVHEYAEAHDIPVFHPKSLKSAEAQAEFAAHDVDVAVVAAYGLILPRAVLDAPKFGCINIHASLLPRWRGASPIQHAIWKGDEKSGVSLMQMDEGLDTGPEIARAEIAITPDTNAQSLHDALSNMGGEMILQVLETLATDGHIDATPQDNSQSSYAPLLKKTDGKIDWGSSATAIDRQIRALNPWPGTYTDGFKIKSACLSEQTTDQPAGTIIDKSGAIACGDGSILQIKTLQPAGKKAMDFASALNGGYVTISDIL